MRIDFLKLIFCLNEMISFLSLTVEIGMIYMIGMNDICNILPVGSIVGYGNAGMYVRAERS